MQIFTSPPSAGDIINELYLKPTGITAEAAAVLCDIPIKQFVAIIEGKEAIGHVLAYKLSQGFNTSYHFWLNLPQASAQAREHHNKPQG